MVKDVIRMDPKIIVPKAFLCLDVLTKWFCMTNTKSCQQYWEKVHIKTCRLQCQQWEADCKCCWRKQSKEWSSITQHSGPLSNWWKFCQCQKCWWCREECHKPSSSQGRFCWAGWWWSGEGIRWWWWSRHRRTGRCESGDHHQHCNQQIDVQCHQNQNILPYFLVKSELYLTWWRVSLLPSLNYEWDN